MTRSDMTDRIMSVSAIVAAIAAVLVAAYEARIKREYQRISVWPRIHQSNTFVPGEPCLPLDVALVEPGPRRPPRPTASSFPSTSSNRKASRWQRC